MYTNNQLESKTVVSKSMVFVRRSKKLPLPWYCFILSMFKMFMNFISSSINILQFSSAFSWQPKKYFKIHSCRLLIQVRTLRNCRHQTQVRNVKLAVSYCSLPKVWTYSSGSIQNVHSTQWPVTTIWCISLGKFLKK